MMEVESLDSLSVYSKDNFNTLNKDVTTASAVTESDVRLVENKSAESPSFQNENSSKCNAESSDEDGPTPNRPKRSLSHKQVRALLDSDSEDEDIFPSTGDRASNDRTLDPEVSKSNRQKSVDTSDSEEEKESDKTISNKKNIDNTNRYAALIDSDSEEEQPVGSQSRKDLEQPTMQPQKNKSQPKTKKLSHRAAKDEAMKQILSESQRLLRESKILLPYHKPKQRTLEEFLKRKKGLTTLPKAPTIAAKLKMSSLIVNKVLEEKEREAEEFFKSSDSEEEEKSENPEPAKPVVTKPVDKLRIISIENIPIEETQKLLKNIQECRNKKEILQQGTVDLGVPRKLFEKEEQSIQKEKDKDLSTSMKYPTVPRKLLETFSDENKTDEDIVQETVNRLIFLVEHMYEESDLQPTDVPDVDRIFETPHIGKEEMTKIFMKDETSIMNNSSTLVVSNVDSNEKKETDSNTITPINILEKSIDDLSFITPKGLAEVTIESPVVKKVSCNSIVSSAKSKLLSNLPSLKPKLRGSPGTTIDLTQEVKPDKKGLNQLLDRFFCKHVKPVKPTENNDVLTVVHVKETEDGPIGVKESLPYKLPTVEAEDPELSKPGAKLVRLRQQLKEQMAIKRDEEWKEKECQEKEDEEEYDEDDFEDEDQDETLKPECNAEDEEDDEDEESDCEIDDVPMKEKRRKKCAFADDEAEVSDGDDTDGTDEEDEFPEKSDTEASNVDMDTNEPPDYPEKRKLKRIIKAFDEDSNNSTVNQNGENDCDVARNPLPRTNTDIDMFDNDNGVDGWGTDIENDIPISQPHVSESTMQCDLTPLRKMNPLGLVSPATQLTPLNVPKSNTAESKNDENIFGSVLGNTSITKLSSPLSNLEKRHSLQKNLFADDALSQPLTNEEKTVIKSGLDLHTQGNTSESQLLELCSGSFNTNPISMKELESIESSPKIVASDLFLLSESLSTEPNQVESNERKNLVNQLRVISSDEEDDAEIEARKIREKKKRKVKQLKLSDDEESDADDVGSNDEDEDKDEDRDQDEKFVDYDSEENEIVVVPKKDMKKYAAGFLEAEAELSESDWDGSDDEDEQGLDKLEFEDGDNEEIDENGAQKELGQFHMKRIRDEDQREVRMLKEFLFEDGDLHTDGSGRERRFKWKNIDKLGEEQNTVPVSDENDGWVDTPEEENELEWRKMKYERAKFVAEKTKMTEDNIEDVFQDSEILQLGMKALQKIKSAKPKSVLSTVVSEQNVKKHTMRATFSEILDVVNGETSNTIQSIIRKRSLLARGEESLARIAMIAKQSEPVQLQTNARSFVFTTINPIEEQSETEPNNVNVENEKNFNFTRRKRKAFSELTPRSAKKSKLGDRQRRTDSRKMPNKV